MVLTESASITDLIAKRVERDDFKLPVFNTVALELQEALNGDIGMKEVEELVLKDQALASELLRVANSAFFSGLAKLDNIRQALVRLGSKQVLNVVMVASQRQAFHADNAMLEDTMAELWRHASASAGGCRWLANRLGLRAEAETAFLCGLLHDLGSLVIVKVMDELMSANSQLDVSEALLVELIDTLHNEYGYQVMNSWKLPENFATIARDHHTKAFDDKNTLMMIVRIVDAACAKVGIGLKKSPEMVLEALPESHMLGVKAVYLAELEIELEEFIDQLAETA